jgi:hypothetical protein
MTLSWEPQLAPKKWNGLYYAADRDYDVAVPADKVVTFTKLQVGFGQGSSWEIFKVALTCWLRFPDAPEVRAAYAVFL